VKNLGETSLKNIFFKKNVYSLLLQKCVTTVWETIYCLLSGAVILNSFNTIFSMD